MPNLTWRIFFQTQVKFLKSGIWFQFYIASNKDTFFLLTRYVESVSKFLALKFQGQSPTAVISPVENDPKSTYYYKVAHISSSRDDKSNL